MRLLLVFKFFVYFVPEKLLQESVAVGGGLRWGSVLRVGPSNLVLLIRLRLAKTNRFLRFNFLRPSCGSDVLCVSPDLRKNISFRGSIPILSGEMRCRLIGLASTFGTLKLTHLNHRWLNQFTVGLHFKLLNY